MTRSQPRGGTAFAFLALVVLACPAAARAQAAPPRMVTLGGMEFGVPPAFTEAPAPARGDTVYLVTSPEGAQLKVTVADFPTDRDSTEDARQRLVQAAADNFRVGFTRAVMAANHPAPECAANPLDSLAAAPAQLTVGIVCVAEGRHGPFTVRYQAYGTRTGNLRLADVTVTHAGKNDPLADPATAAAFTRVRLGQPEWATGLARLVTVPGTGVQLALPAGFPELEPGSIPGLRSYYTSDGRLYVQVAVQEFSDDPPLAERLSAIPEMMRTLLHALGGGTSRTDIRVPPTHIGGAIDFVDHTTSTPMRAELRLFLPRSGPMQTVNVRIVDLTGGDPATDPVAQGIFASLQFGR